MTANKAGISGHLCAREYFWLPEKIAIRRKVLGFWGDRHVPAGPPGTLAGWFVRACPTSWPSCYSHVLVCVKGERLFIHERRIMKLFNGFNNVQQIAPAFIYYAHG